MTLKLFAPLIMSAGNVTLHLVDASSVVIIRSKSPRMKKTFWGD